MTREEQIDEIVKHLAGLYEHAENRDYRYSISALLRMAIAWADENPVEKNDGILVMRCTNLIKEQIEEFQKHKGILTICKPTKQDCITEFLQRTECLSCSLFTNCKKRWDKNCEDYKPEEIIKIQDL